MTVPAGGAVTEARPLAARHGPRPLALHLGIAVNTWCGGMAALPRALSGGLAWHPNVADAADRQFSGCHDGTGPGGALPYQAVAEEAFHRLREMIDGILAYRRHPYRRALPDPPVVWEQGTTRLLDYGQAGPAATVLFVPSLVNRAYILDLSERRSLMRFLAQRGLRPLLLDWGRPGPSERRFGLADYIDGRVERALDAAVEIARGPVGLVGYCMGGNLTLPVALRRPGDVAAAGFLATPWDFHAEQGLPERLLPLATVFLDPILRGTGELPVDCLQAYFAALNPNLAGIKFRNFGRLDQDTAAAADFVALEDWLNDGVPLVAAVARECLVEWYGNNALGRGEWRLAGRRIDPSKLAVPALVASPFRDRIVRPGSSRALADAIPGALAVDPPSGHIGMMVGSRARHGLWEPLEAWLHNHVPRAR